jgi:hypothetical protein
LRILDIRAASVCPLNGGCPNNISKNTTPTAHTSPYSVCPYYLNAYGLI